VALGFPACNADILVGAAAPRMAISFHDRPLADFRAKLILMKLTRRQLAAVVVSATAMAHTRQTPASSADELQAARERIKANGEALAQQQIPMATEPAFQFKA